MIIKVVDFVEQKPESKLSRIERWLLPAASSSLVGALFVFIFV